jgi:hypothetical protein
MRVQSNRQGRYNLIDASQQRRGRGAPGLVLRAQSMGRTRPSSLRSHTTGVGSLPTVVAAGPTGVQGAAGPAVVPRRLPYGQLKAQAAPVAMWATEGASKTITTRRTSGSTDPPGSIGCASIATRDSQLEPGPLRSARTWPMMGPPAPAGITSFRQGRGAPSRAGDHASNSTDDLTHAPMSAAGETRRQQETSPES